MKTHVARVLQKLDLRDGVQAVIFAYESGFVEAGEPEWERRQHAASEVGPFRVSAWICRHDD